MSWLKAVIARLLGHTMPPLGNPVPPTQTVGLVSKEHTPQAGNKRSAPRSTQRPKPVTQKRSSKPKVAKPTTQASSRKAEPKSAPKVSGVNGKQRKTPARQTPQAVKSAPKRKP